MFSNSNHLQIKKKKSKRRTTRRKTPRTVLSKTPRTLFSKTTRLKDKYVLSAHGSMYPFVDPIDISKKNISVVFYTDFGGTCYATNRDPNLVCKKRYMKGRSVFSHDRPREFNNLVPELFFWPLRTTMDSHSGVKQCNNNKIIMNFDNHQKYPDKIMPWDLYACRPYKIFLSEVIDYIYYNITKNFTLHILTCLDIPYNYNYDYLPKYSGGGNLLKNKL